MRNCLHAIMLVIVCAATVFTPLPAVGADEAEEHRYLYVATPGVRNYLEYGGHGLLVFDLRSIAPAVSVTMVLLVGLHLAERAGWIAYAPALLGPPYDGTTPSNATPPGRKPQGDHQPKVRVNRRQSRYPEGTRRRNSLKRLRFRFAANPLAV